MNRKKAWVYCPKCGLGFRHFNSETEATQALAKHSKWCRGVKSGES